MEKRTIPVLLPVEDELYLKYTYAWRSKSTEKSEDWLGYFFIDDKAISGYYFQHEDMIRLVSVPGVTTVKIRFGIRENYLVLLIFGADNAEERRTPYFVIDEFVPIPDEIEKESKNVGENEYGNVPDVLAHQWIKNWSLVKPRNSTFPNSIPIDKKFFETHYGFLQGYNYSVTEIIDTLYRNKKNKSNSDLSVILIEFALHRYIHFDPAVFDNSRKEKSTFGLIFHPINKINRSNGATPQLLISGYVDASNESDSVFYDLSMPCPRTC